MRVRRDDVGARARGSNSAARDAERYREFARDD